MESITDSDVYECPQLSEKDIYSVGDVVAYEYLEGEQFWQWAVAKIIDKPTPRICQLQLWHPQERLLSDAEEQRKKKMADAIQVKSAAAEAERAAIERLKKQLSDDTTRITTTRRLAEANIAKLQPIVEAAKRGLNSIKDEHLREMRSYPTPPPMVKKVLEAVMICFNQNPTSWSVIREFVRKDEFIATVRDFEPSSLTEDSRQKLTNGYANDRQFTFENAQRASRAAGPLLQWVLAQLEYANIMKQVIPLQDEIEELAKAQHANELKLGEEQRKSSSLDAELKALQSDFDQLVFGGSTQPTEDAGPVSFSEWVPSKDPIEEKYILHSTILRAVATTASDNAVALEKSDVNLLKNCPYKAGRDVALEAKAKQLQEDLDAAEEDLMDKALELNVEKEDCKKKREQLADLHDAVEAMKAQFEKEKDTVANEKMALEMDLVEAQERQTKLEEKLQQNEKQRNDTMSSAAADHEAALEALKQERDNETKRTVSLEHDISTLKQRLNDSEDAKNKQVAELQALLVQAKEDAAREMEVLKQEMANTVAGLEKQLVDRPASFAPAPAAVKSTMNKETQTGEDQRANHIDPHEPAAPHPQQQPEAEAEELEEEEEEYEEEEKYEEEEDEDWIPIHEIDEQARFLIAAFEITKLVKGKLPGVTRLKRVWVIDQLQQKFHNLNENGTKVTKSFQHTQLIMLEKSFDDPFKLQLLFYGKENNHELLFSTPYARERFYELAQAMRSTVVCYAPMLVNHDFIESSHVKVTIDANEGIQVCDKLGNLKNVKGQCTINASVMPTEDLRVWVGSHCWGKTCVGMEFEELGAWVPRVAEFDLYAIAITDAPLPPANPTNILSDEKRYEEFFNKWYAMLKAYLGTGYQPVAPIAHKGMTLIVFARSKLLSKISAVEGAKVCTSGLDESLGACGIVFRVFDTDFCFVSCKLQQHLHASELTALVDEKNADTGVDEPSIMPTAQELEEELNRKRQQQMAMICKNLQFSICDGEFSNQFDHVFLCGDFGYTLDPQAGGALQAAAKQADPTTRRNPGGYNEVLRSYDGLCRARAKDGFMSAFQLPPTAFPPTSPSTAASSGGDGVGPTLPAPPSYLTRILYRSVEEPLRRFRCMAYDACDQLAAEQRSSPFTPVKAHFAVRMARPSLACLHRTQAPVPVITLEKVSVSSLHPDGDFESSTTFEIKKPVLQLYAPFSSCHGGRFACTESNTAQPIWLSVASDDQVKSVSSPTSSPLSPPAGRAAGLRSAIRRLSMVAAAPPPIVLPTALPKLECLTQIIPTIESKHCYLVLQDDNVPKTKPTHILGTASLSLRGRLTEDLRGVSQAFTSDLVANGCLVGTLSGSLHWDASVEGPELLTRGINLASADL